MTRIRIDDLYFLLFIVVIILFSSSPTDSFFKNVMQLTNDRRNDSNLTNNESKPTDKRNESNHSLSPIIMYQRGESPRALNNLLCGDSIQPVTERNISWVRNEVAQPHDTRDLPLELHISGCNITGCSGEWIENCLRGRHIVFIGDSLTRYQYLNLAQRLTYSNWTAFHGSAPLSESERTWSSWPLFMEQTNLRLRGLEICDCFREHGHPWIAENRYYFNPALNVRLTYIFMTEVGGSRYHSLDFLNASCGESCGCKGCVPGPKCRLDVEDFALNHYRKEDINAQARFLQSLVVGSVSMSIQLAPVDALVLNIGYFGGAGWHKESNTYRDGAISKDIYKRAMVNVTASLQALDPPPRALIWKVTTASVDNDYVPAVEVQWVNSTLVPLGWQMFDAYSITRTFEGKTASFIENDGVHFQPHVYQGLNKALTLHLCGHAKSSFRAPTTKNFGNHCHIRV